MTDEIGIDRLDTRATRLTWIGLVAIAATCALWSLKRHDFDLAAPGAVAAVVASVGLLAAPRLPIVAVALGLIDLAVNWPVAALFFATTFFAIRVRRQPELAVAALFAAAFVVALLFPGPREPGAGPALNAAIVAVLVPGLLGLMVRSAVVRLRLRGERDAERLQKALLENENADMTTRLRIAQELHDGLGHHLSLIVLGLSGIDGLLGRDDQKARSLLQDVQTLGHQAMSELRDAVLAGTAAQPTTDTDTHEAVARIVDRAGRAGLDITLQTEGSVILDPAGRDLVERIVTEGVTNVAKHAPGAATIVGLRALPGGRACIEVVNGAAPHGAPDVPESGTGLPTLRTAVEHAGGILDAGPTPTGGYRLAVSLPSPAPPTGESP